VSRDETRNLVENHWLSLLPPEQRPGLVAPCDDPEAEQWNALVAADLSLDDGLTGSGRGSRVIGALAAAGLAAALLLALNGPGRSDPSAGNGSSASASGSVTAGGTDVAEQNRVVLATTILRGEAGTPDRAPGRSSKDGRGNGAPTKPSTPPSPDPGGTGGPGSENPGTQPPPLASTTLPVVGDVTVPQPNLGLPPLPPVQVPPVQLPPVQLPELPPLLPPGQQQ
jgi:hypothetical protein